MTGELLALRIAADIGGTWARFTVADADGQILLAKHKLATDDLGTGSGLGDELVALGRRVARARGAVESRLAQVVLAVAGPVQRGRARMTNGALRLDEQALSEACGCPVLLYNDFFALAHGLDLFQQVETLGSASPASGKLRLVLGPGSGLGMALCVPSASGTAGEFQVLPSEFGHAPLAAESVLQRELLPALAAAADDAPLIWESVLSGPGLLRLYRALAAVEGVAPMLGTPEAVSSAAATGLDPLAQRTVTQFGAWLGLCAASAALSVCAEGGVYLVGDLLRVMLSSNPGLKAHIRSHFEGRPEPAGYLPQIALQLVLDADPGLLGAQALAARIATAEGR